MTTVVGPNPAEGARVQRLVLVAGIDLHWPRETATVECHLAMLRALLAGHEEATWFARIHESSRDSPTGHRHRREPAVIQEPVWSTGEDVPLAELAADLHRQLVPEDDDLPGEAPEIRHRVVMTRDAFEAVFAPQHRTEFACVSLDFRFLRIQMSHVCHVRTAVWSRIPFSSWHRPAQLAPRPGPDRPTPPFTVTPGVVCDYLDRIHGSIQETFEREWTLRPAYLTVVGRRYLPSVFWLVSPLHNELRDHPRQYAAETTVAPELRAVLGTLLCAGSVEDDALAAATVDGRLATFRRVLETSEDHLGPTYVMVPSRPAGPGDANAPDAEIGSRDEERNARTIVELARLETQVGELLFDKVGDVEMWNHHLKVYECTVARGSLLWDALSTHLLLATPDRKHLATTHRYAELIHQTLLQGMADAEQTAAALARTETAVRGDAHEISATFDEALAEAPLRDRQAIRPALTTTGYFSSLELTLLDGRNRAHRVRQSYREMVESISAAFDERRVRESDVIQRGSSIVGITLAILGLVTILDASLDGWKLAVMSNPAGPSVVGQTSAWVLRVAAWGIGLVIIYRGVLALWDLRRLHDLGGKRFQRTYEVVWDLVRTTSTDALAERVQEIPAAARSDPAPQEVPPPAPQEAPTEDDIRRITGARDERTRQRWRYWAEVDRELALALAWTWDTVCSFDRDERPRPEGRRRTADDLRRVSHDIEVWTLQTMIVTERARGLWRHGVPRLVCLYYLVPPPDPPDTEPSMSGLVSDEELRLALMVSCRMLGPEVTQLQGWLDEQRGRARDGRLADVLARLELAGLTAGIDGGSSVLAQLGLEAPEPDPTPPPTPP